MAEDKEEGGATEETGLSEVVEEERS